MRELQSNDRLAIKALYQRYRSEFIGFGKRYGLDEHDLADVYQEAFLALRKRALQGKLDAVESSLKTYLFGIGKHKIYDTLKRKGKTQPYESRLHVVDTDIPEIEIGAVEPLTERQVMLRKHLKKLGDKCREVLTLFYYRGLNIEEIVTLAGYRNANVVKAHKSRCLKTLREMMRQ